MTALEVSKTVKGELAVVEALVVSAEAEERGLDAIPAKQTPLTQHYAQYSIQIEFYQVRSSFEFFLADQYC